MAFDSTIQGVWQFQESLNDEVQSNDFSNPLLLAPDYERFQKYNLINDTLENRFGLEIEVSKNFTAGSSFSFVIASTYRLGIGFWWNSTSAIGFTKHTITRNLTPLIAPILAKADSSTASGIETPSNAEFIVSEVGASSTKNAIELALCIGGGAPTHIFRSESYLPGLRHVFISYKEISASLGFARIDIDGKHGIQFAAPGGLTTQTGDLRINDIGYDYTAHHATATGSFISDLVVKASASTDSQDTIRMFRYGWEFITMTDLLFDEFSTFGASYLQPSTITTNQIYAEGGNIFAARSNGELVKGSRPIWDKEFTYVDPDSLKFLTISERDDIRKAEWTPSGLKLTGTIITI